MNAAASFVVLVLLFAGCCAQRNQSIIFRAEEFLDELLNRTIANPVNEVGVFAPEPVTVDIFGTSFHIFDIILIGFDSIRRDFGRAAIDEEVVDGNSYIRCKLVNDLRVKVKSSIAGDIDVYHYDVRFKMIWSLEILMNGQKDDFGIISLDIVDFSDIHGQRLRVTRDDGETSEWEDVAEDDPRLKSSHQFWFHLRGPLKRQLEAHFTAVIAGSPFDQPFEVRAAGSAPFGSLLLIGILLMLVLE